jgi:hypothetical protein
MVSTMQIRGNPYIHGVAECSQEIRQVPERIIHPHNRTTLHCFLIGRLHEPKHVLENFGLTCEETTIDFERGGRLVHQDNDVAVVKPQVTMVND